VRNKALRLQGLCYLGIDEVTTSSNKGKNDAKGLAKG
jgi:hypothetical protein